MRFRAFGGVLGLCVAFGLLAACAPRVDLPGPAVAEPRLADEAVVTPDGARLPLRVWPAESETRAVIVALHGFNDYGNFIAEPAAYFAAHGIATYAYDQRGFGAAPHPGIWAGQRAMTDDLKTVADLVRRRHPGVPLYLLGASMGGAVVITAVTGDDPPAADGVILSGPAVWARATMPFYQRWALWLSAHTVPWMTVTGRGLGIRPSDNIVMLRALGRDPLVIKETRIDTIYGLVNLMDAALASASRLDAESLILVGINDQIIPAAPTRRMLEELPVPAPRPRTVAVYDKGFHMLLRDLQRETVWRDIVAWIDNPKAALPSGAETRVAAFLDGK